MTSKLFYCSPANNFTRSSRQARADLLELCHSHTEASWDSQYDLLHRLLRAIALNESFNCVVNDGTDEAASASQVFTPCSEADSRVVAMIGDLIVGNRCGESLLSLLRKSTARIQVHTSGSTGRAKVVSHSVPSLTRAVVVNDERARDVWGTCYKFDKMAGLQVFFQAICNQNALIQLSNLGDDELHASIEDNQITHLAGTPSFLRLLAASKRKHLGVKRISVGGEAFQESITERLKVVFPNADVTNIYASTEAGSLLRSHGEVFTVPSRYKNLIVCRAGQLAIHRTLLAESMQVACHQGYFLTGDDIEVIADEPLSFRFLARREDWINVGGNKVNPNVVQALLEEMDEILEAMVFGKTNSVVGHIVCCKVRLRDGATLQQGEIRRRLVDKLPGYCIPASVEIVEAIAKNDTWKKLRPV